MSNFPVEPEIARMIIVASALGCAEQILVIAAVLSGDKDLLVRPVWRCFIYNVSKILPQFNAKKFAN